MILESKKDKGRAGLSLAIAYFGCNGYTVNIPLNDTQPYDMIIEKNGEMARVSVKFTGQTSSTGDKKKYIVDLRSCGGKDGSKVYSDFKSSGVDFLFIVTEEKTMFLIPKSAVKTKTLITLTNDFLFYQVTI